MLGKVEMAGRVERRLRPSATPGYWGRHVHKESALNTGPQSVVSDDQPEAREGQVGRPGVAERFVVCAGQRMNQEGYPTKRLLGEFKLVNLVSLIPSLRISLNHSSWLFENWIRIRRSRGRHHLPEFSPRLRRLRPSPRLR